MAARKTHKSALVLIPPPSVWGPIQELRYRYDRKVRRWMPHITLLYPFYPREFFPELLPPLQNLCARWAPVQVRFRHIRLFHHGASSHTLWLAPEPEEPLRALQAQLQELFPDCSEQSRYPEGFVPHLSIGQFYGPRTAAEDFRRRLMQDWQTLECTLDALSLIARDDPPEDIFREEFRIPFGQPALATP
jgi:2'-5' RNA ligase